MPTNYLILTSAWISSAFSEGLRSSWNDTEVRTLCKIVLPKYPLELYVCTKKTSKQHAKNIALNPLSSPTYWGRDAQTNETHHPNQSLHRGTGERSSSSSSSLKHPKIQKHV